KLKARNKIVACLSISDLPTKFVCLTQIWRAKPFHPWQCLTANSRLTKVFSRRRFLNQRQSYLLTIRTRGMRGGGQTVEGARISWRVGTTGVERAEARKARRKPVESVVHSRPGLEPFPFRYVCHGCSCIL